MGITSDRESPRQIAALVEHHHRSASWRLDLALEILRQLGTDCSRLGFPNTAAVLALGEAAVADATTVARALDAAIERREEEAARRVSADGEVSPNQARAEVLVSDVDVADEKLDTSRSKLALGRLEDAAAELESEGRA